MKQNVLGPFKSEAHLAMAIALLAEMMRQDRETTLALLGVKSRR